MVANRYPYFWKIKKEIWQSFPDCFHENDINLRALSHGRGRRVWYCPYYRR